MNIMHQTDHEALRERGHDPNAIIFSEPARRECIKGDMQYSNSLNNCPVDNIKSNSRYQKLPLRMLISQTAYRDPGPRFQEKQIDFPSKSQQNILSVSAKIMQRDTYPYSQYSRHAKHDVVSSSIKMWLRNSYTRNNSMASHTSGITKDTTHYSELHGYPQISSTVYDKSCEEKNLFVEDENLNTKDREKNIFIEDEILNTKDREKNIFIEDEILKTKDRERNDIQELREISDIQFESNNSKDTLNISAIETDKLTSFESILLDNQNSDSQDYDECNDTFDLSRKENSQVLPSKHSFASMTESIEFVWDPVSSQSLNEINFNCTSIDFQQNNLNVSHKSSTSSSNSYPTEFYVSDHLEFSCNNSFISFENNSEKCQK